MSEVNKAERFAKNAVKRWDEDEKEAVLSILLDSLTAKEKEEVNLVSFGELFEQAKSIADKGNSFQGLSTGYRCIDEMTKGLNGGDILTIFAGTHQGKSQLTQNIAVNVAKAGKVVLFIGLEMTNTQNSARFVQMGANDALLPFVFPDKPDISYTDIKTFIEKAKGDNVALVVVDQLQDLIHSTVNEQGEIGQIMAELKRAAITNDVPMIVVSHVNRTEDALKAPPTMSALKGSSSIAQKTDMAIAVYQNNEAEPGDEDYKKMYLSLRKNRVSGMGGTKRAVLYVQPNARLVEWKDEIFESEGF